MYNKSNKAIEDQSLELLFGGFMDVHVSDAPALLFVTLEVALFFAIFGLTKCQHVCKLACTIIAIINSKIDPLDISGSRGGYICIL